MTATINERIARMKILAELKAADAERRRLLKEAQEAARAKTAEALLAALEPLAGIPVAIRPDSPGVVFVERDRARYDEEKLWVGSNAGGQMIVQFFVRTGKDGRAEILAREYDRADPARPVSMDDAVELAVKYVEKHLDIATQAGEQIPF